MLVNIGQRRGTGDLVDLLLDCHERIRLFVRLSLALGRPEVSAPEARELAARVRRYFSEALPLHVLDEEESLVPRLRGCDPEVDAALGRMHAEHAGHAPLIEELLVLTGGVLEDPSRHGAAAPGLASVARRLEREFEAHLASEERHVFPAVRRVLGAEGQHAALQELRARRVFAAVRHAPER